MWLPVIVALQSLNLFHDHKVMTLKQHEMQNIGNEFRMKLDGNHIKVYQHHHLTHIASIQVSNNHIKLSNNHFTHFFHFIHPAQQIVKIDHQAHSFKINEFQYDLLHVFQLKWRCSTRNIKNGNYTENHVQYTEFDTVISGNGHASQVIWEYIDSHTIQISHYKRGNAIKLSNSDVLAALIDQTDDSIFTCDIKTTNSPYLQVSVQNRNIQKCQIHIKFENQLISKMLSEHGNLIKLMVFGHFIYVFIGSHLSISGNVIYIIMKPNEYYMISSIDFLMKSFQIGDYIMSGNDIAIQNKVSEKINAKYVNTEITDLQQFAIYFSQWKQ
eukprot:NODE_47_length_32105_cov_1.240892.p8 type:complete len:327 gc:universal NODE_47_length_32105_cov_1.240892:11960-12940(+)